MNVVLEEGEPCTLEELECGSLFKHEGTIALKTEYSSNSGLIEAYIVGSGEHFWGGTSTPSEQSQLIVTPLTLII